LLDVSEYLKLKIIRILLIPHVGFELE